MGNYWNNMPSLNVLIYLAKNPELISNTCKQGKTQKGHIMNSGILRLSVGCAAKMEHTTLIGIQMNVNSEGFICNPGFALNISEIYAIIYWTMTISKIKPFLWEKEKNE